MKSNGTTRYIHKEGIHNTGACASLVEILYERLQPNSVIDFGCGTGNFLRQFKERGVRKICGLDGPWVPRDTLRQFISLDEFHEVDLEFPQDVGQKFDIALSLEVAEHLSESGGQNLIKSLINASDIVVFSAGIPGQPGDRHINCQWPEYWASQFRVQGFAVYDVFRNEIWNETSIPWWYRQNVFLAVNINNEPAITRFGPPTDLIRGVVHPEHYQIHIDLANSIFGGQFPLLGYLSMMRKRLLGR